MFSFDLAAMNVERGLCNVQCSCLHTYIVFTHEPLNHPTHAEPNNLCLF